MRNRGDGWTGGKGRVRSATGRRECRHRANQRVPEKQGQTGVRVIERGRGANNRTRVHAGAGGVQDKASTAEEGDDKGQRCQAGYAEGQGGRGALRGMRGMRGRKPTKVRGRRPAAICHSWAGRAGARGVGFPTISRGKGGRGTRLAAAGFPRVAPAHGGTEGTPAGVLWGGKRTQG